MLNTRQHEEVRRSILDVQFAALHEYRFNADELFAESFRARFCESLLEAQLTPNQRRTIVSLSYDTTTDATIQPDDVSLLIAAHHIANYLHEAAMKRRGATA